MNLAKANAIIHASCCDTATGPRLAPNGLPTSMEEPPDKLAQARFEAALDTRFELELPATGKTLSLHLFEVTARNAPPGYEQYSAIFRGPAAPVLPQATYVIRHPALGEVSLFIVPVGRDASSVTYEACVARRTATIPDPRS